MREQQVARTIWDKLGISLSVLCAVHCLTFPILFSLLPLWHGNEALEGWIHVGFLIFIIPTIFLALKNPHSKQVIYLLLSGFGILVIALGVGVFFDETTETVVTLIGSSLLITGHLKNYRSHLTHVH